MQKINLHLDTSEAIDPNSLRFNALQLIPLQYLVVILPNKCLRNIAHVNGLSSPMYFMNAPYRSLLTRLKALYINELIKLQLV